MLRIHFKNGQFSQPAVMGILNVTPDSFACHCSSLNRDAILTDCAALLDHGADILDVGACSTRPNSELASEQEEWQRLEIALPAIRERYPQAIISLDTFRASIAERAIQQFGIDIINDVSGLADPQMLDIIARTRVTYILTHPRKDCQILSFFAYQLDRLHRAGVSDVIIDPGIGFGKTIQQNYAILHHIGLLKHLGAPVLIGLSRKSMLYEPLHITPQDALNATTAAHVLALMNGADILRVHDVHEARQAIDIVSLYNAFKL